MGAGEHNRGGGCFHWCQCNEHLRPERFFQSHFYPEFLQLCQSRMGAYPLTTLLQDHSQDNPNYCTMQDLDNIRLGIYKAPWDMQTLNRQFNPFVMASRCEGAGCGRVLGGG